MKISLVIPCYGSEQTIAAVISEIDTVMALHPEYNYEIICVNDSSPDNVLSVLYKITESNKRLVVADLGTNFGKENAVLAGYSLSTGDYVCCLDDDGQCPMDRFWDLFAPLEKGYDISFAAYPKKKQSGFKRFGSFINKKMAEMLIGMPKDISISNFSIAKRFIIDEFAKCRNPHPYVLGIALRSTNRITNVAMEERERIAGKGGFTFKKSLALWLNGFTAYSIKPLRVASIMGFFAAVVGFVIAFIIVIRKLFFVPEMAVGYASMISLILIVGGLIMMMLGILGEYVGRIYININSLPQYVIREVKKEGMNKC
jgi:undecaprenyl-phosphate 4-deoxy-4-formamido-L-arabinose transferase